MKATALRSIALLFSAVCLGQAQTVPVSDSMTLDEYEMMHGGGGNRTGPLMQGGNRAAFDKHQMMPRLWGEDFLITYDVVSFTR